MPEISLIDPSTMAKFVVVLAVLLHVALSAPADDAQKFDLNQLTAQIEDVANGIKTSLQSNLPDKDAIAAQTQQFAQEIEGIVKKLQTEIDNNKGKADDVLKEVSAKLTETVNSLRELAGADATKKGDELRTQLESNLNSVVSQFEKLNEAVQPSLQQAGDNLANFARGVFGDFIQAASNFHAEVKNAIDKH